MKRGIARRVEIETEVVPGSKRCGACGKAKPFGQFYLNRNKADGLSWDCKECHRRAGTEWRRKHPRSVPQERAREYEAKYRRSAHGQAVIQAYQKSARGRLMHGKGLTAWRLRQATHPARRQRLKQLIRMYEQEIDRITLKKRSLW